jgi:hypothetical protein
MTKSNGWLAIGGIFSLFAAASAQTSASATASTQFDGTCAFVSSTKVHGLRCPEGRAGSLTIINGQARLPAFEGRVGSRGELMMRHIPEPSGRNGFSELAGVEGNVSGRIDANGTVRARQTGWMCNYDLMWQKAQR